MAMSAADTPSDIVKMFMDDLETNDQQAAANTLTDNFTFSGWTALPLNKQQFLSVIAGLKEGIPNLIFNLHNMQEAGNTVTGTIQVVGYQTSGFTLPTLGLPPIPQMARSISMPTEDITYVTEDITYVLENGQIARMDVQSDKDGGIGGMLHQLGIDVPIVQ